MSSGKCHPAFIFSSFLLFLHGKPNVDEEGCALRVRWSKGPEVEPCILFLPPGLHCFALQHIGTARS